jgi:fused signal recognition particle receptor
VIETSEIAFAVVAAGLVGLFVAAGVRLARKRRQELRGPPSPKLSDEQIERELEAEAERVPVVAAPEGAQLPESVATQNQAEKEAEEARKREAYQAQKQARLAEQERKRQEREEQARREEEAKRQLAEEEAKRQAAEAEERKRKEQAVAGKTLAEGLARTRGGFVARLQSLLGANKPVDDQTLAQLEEILFTADIGVKTATKLVEFARERIKSNSLSAETLKGAIRDEVEHILHLNGAAPATARPYVIMVLGVNGVGKTTTIGKLAARYAAQGKRVILAAGDTFRAAATEQLEIWAKRAGVPIVTGKEGSDPSSVVFETIKRAQTEGIDVVIADTAGRLHTKAPLMEELRKVKRVIGKAMEGAPHEVLLVLDATTGQNAIAQARQFHEVLGVTAIALSKLDGTAKGGVIIGICDELKIPVRYVGVGEAIEDLKPFDPKEFVGALFEN